MQDIEAPASFAHTHSLKPLQGSAAAEFSVTSGIILLSRLYQVNHNSFEEYCDN